MTCFLSLILYRYLEKALDNKFTVDEILDTLRDMEMLSTPGEGYIPTYIRTDVTDALHEVFGFRTDYEIVSQKEMRKIFQTTKSEKRYSKIPLLKNARILDSSRKSGIYIFSNCQRREYKD